MYLAIDTLTEHQKRKKPGFFNRLLSRPELWGYDLADVAGFNEWPVKRVSVDKEQYSGWYELTNPDNRIVVLFGNNFGELIKYEAGQMIFHQWKSVPSSHDFLSAESGTLEYLLDFDRRGRPGIFLSDRFSSLSNHGQGRCKEGAWPCCNMTLQLTPSQPDVIIQVDKGKAVLIGRVKAAEDIRIPQGYWTGDWKTGSQSRRNSTQERLKVPRLDHPNGSFTSPGACAHCSGANHLDDGSDSGNSSPETERDMAAGSETSNTATPQSGYTGNSY
ncbi:hypothetical protein BJ166DRAFT_336243 [Pestalotiopsis sp. NC0098]|nr:hypothetical protein BJ166DRAFT_336243 [Pestalotiopsis sp. NC0098]